MLYLVLCVPSLTLSQSKVLLQASNLNFKFSILYQRVIELATNAVRASHGPAVVTLNVKNPLGRSSVGEMGRGQSQMIIDYQRIKNASTFTVGSPLATFLESLYICNVQ